MGVETFTYSNGPIGTVGAARWENFGTMAVDGGTLGPTTAPGSAISKIALDGEFDFAVKITAKPGGGFELHVGDGLGDSEALICQVDIAGGGQWRIQSVTGAGWGSPVSVASASRGGGSLSAGECVRFRQTISGGVGTVRAYYGPTVDLDGTWTEVLTGTSSDHLDGGVIAVASVSNAGTRVDDITWREPVGETIAGSFRLSGGASNTNAAASIGGASSTTVYDGTTTDGDLFDDSPYTEYSDGHVDYRVLNVHNTGTADAAATATVSVQGMGGVAYAVATATQPAGTPMTALASDTTTPSGVTFGTSANLGTIPAGSFRALILRRTITAGSPAAPAVTGEVQVEFEAA